MTSSHAAGIFITFALEVVYCKTSDVQQCLRSWDVSHSGVLLITTGGTQAHDPGLQEQPNGAEVPSTSKVSFLTSCSSFTTCYQ